MTVRILVGDVREQLRLLPDESVHCVVTSPPYYGLRDYGVAGQIGLETTPAEFLAVMVDVFREVRRVLRSDGTAWVNMGDSYAGSWGAQSRGNGTNLKSTLEGSSMLSARQIAAHHTPGIKPKDMMGMPWRLAFALQDDGWYLRQDIIWSKTNPMPESVRDRCTKSHEYIFLLSKSERYYFDQDAIAEPCSASTHARLSQNVAAQVGSERAHAGGKTNGNMKAVARKADDGVGRRDVPPGNRPDGKGLIGSAASARFGRGPGWRKSTGVGFGHGFDVDPKPRVKNNESFDQAMAIMPLTRNKRSVWTMNTEGFKGAHFATFPTELPRLCISAGCPAGGVVLDPFFGAGTTGLVADRLQRDCIGIELNPEYAEMARRRIYDDAPLFATP